MAREIGPFEAIRTRADETICTRIRGRPPPPQDTGKTKLNTNRRWRQRHHNGTIANRNKAGTLKTLPLRPTDRANALQCLHSHVAIRRLQKRAGKQQPHAPAIEANRPRQRVGYALAFPHCHSQVAKTPRNITMFAVSLPRRLNSMSAAALQRRHTQSHEKLRTAKRATIHRASTPRRLGR